MLRVAKCRGVFVSSTSIPRYSTSLLLCAAGTSQSTSNRCTNLITSRVQCIRRCTTEAQQQGKPTKRGSGRIWWSLLLGGTAVSGVTLLLADANANVRRTIESNVPYSDRLFNRYMGEPGSRTMWKSMFSSRPPVKDSAMMLPSSSSVAISEPKPISKPKMVDVDLTKSPIQQAAKKEPKSAVSRDAQMHKDIKHEQFEQELAMKNVDERVRATLNSADNMLKRALEMKRVLIQQINVHAKLLRKAIDSPTDENWAEVTEAQKEIDKSMGVDRSRESDARNYLETLKKVINDGKASSKTADHPLLNSAQSTMGDLVYQLEESIAQVRQAQTESRIMTEYRKLIETSREQFANELRAILPNVDIHAKENKLTEDELNSLIAHAHLRIDQLRKQLTEQQLREQQHIQDALSEQKADGQRYGDEQLERELKRMETHYRVNSEQKLAEAKAGFEVELRSQLRRAAAAHSEHLEEVRRVQQQQLEAQTAQRVNDALMHERDEFNSQMANTFDRLNQIEQALNDRAELDAENKRAKELWLACQNLVESVTCGRKDATDCDQRRKPLANELMAIRESCANDTFVQSVFDSFSDEAIHTGVYTEEDLRARFKKVRQLCLRTAMVDDNGGSVFRYALSALQSSIMFDTSRLKHYSLDDLIDVNNIDTHEVLARARYHLDEHDDMSTAIRLLHLLRGEPARIASDWLRDARLHLEAKQAANLLLSHAAALSMQTVY